VPAHRTTHRNLLPGAATWTSPGWPATASQPDAVTAGCFRGPRSGVTGRRAPLNFRGTLRLCSDRQLCRSRRRGTCCCGYFLPKLSNSPFRAPPRKACHSSGVNRRTGPSESLLLRTPIPPSGRLATSTQFPLEKLRELLTQLGADPGLSGIGLSTLLPH
jgi:hypothetical protein